MEEITTEMIDAKRLEVMNYITARRKKLTDAGYNPRTVYMGESVYELFGAPVCMGNMLVVMLRSMPADAVRLYPDEFGAYAECVDIEENRASWGKAEHTVREYTGLSEDAIATLHRMNENGNKMAIENIERMISTFKSISASSPM